MTRRVRLTRLEDRRGDGQRAVVGIFEADTCAGLWREVNGPRTLPLSPDDLQAAHSAAHRGCGVVLIDPGGVL